MDDAKVSVLIVNFNAGERLRKCIDHLLNQSFQDFDIIILDNASADGSADGVESLSDKINLIKSPTNLGFAAGNNLAVKSAKGEWLAFLNPDAYPDPDWLEQLMIGTQNYPWADAFGSVQLNAIDRNILDGVGDVYHVFGVPWRGGFGQAADIVLNDGECFTPCAAAALYKRQVFIDLSGFDERFFCYGEDVDLGFRLRLAGGRAVQIADAIVAHEGSAVSGRHSDFTIYHGHRNRIWTWFKNMPLIMMIGFLPGHVLVNLYLGVRSFKVGLHKAYWRAMMDGYKGLGPILKSRKQIHQNRKTGMRDLAKAMTWSPVKISKRSIDLKPLYRGKLSHKK